MLSSWYYCWIINSFYFQKFFFYILEKLLKIDENGRTVSEIFINSNLVIKTLTQNSNVNRKLKLLSYHKSTTLTNRVEE